MIDRFAATTPDPVPSGGTLNICFDDSALAGQTVTIEIDNGTDQATLDITLDGNGHGCKGWTVPPGWTVVKLNHPTSAQHTVAVIPPQ